MKDVNGLATCDAEIGPVSKARPLWRACRAKATVAIETRNHYDLHYCNRHAHHADDKTGLYFQAKPFAVPRAIA